MSNKYRYIGTCQIPRYGSIGDAYPASGCDDWHSAEYGAWLFVPDVDPVDPEGERGGYYVDPASDLSLVSIDVSHLSDSERLAMDLRDDPHSLGVYSE